MKGEGIGFGKAILFNEHFVVYGVPAIVSAIGKYTIAKVEPLSTHGLKLEDKRDATPRYKEDKLGQQTDSINRILKAMNIDTSKKGMNESLRYLKGVGPKKEQIFLQLGIAHIADLLHYF